MASDPISKMPEKVRDMIKMLGSVAILCQYTMTIKIEIIDVLRKEILDYNKATQIQAIYKYIHNKLHIRPGKMPLNTCDTYKIFTY